MTVQVIAEFIDRATGQRVRPGDPVPVLSADAIRRLQRAGCLRVDEPEPVAETARRRRRRKTQEPPQPPAEGSGDGGLFPDVDAAGAAGPDPAAVAGGDGGDPGRGPEPDAS